jgi:hemerythrin-like metal-binding protein
MNDQKTDMSILLVDDEEIYILILEELLQKNGYGVIEARDGNEAVEKAVGFFPDLILLDIVMPEMDGYEVCMRLKENPMTKDIPIIFVTAKKEEVNEELGLEFGAVDYITKPYDPAVVLSRVKTHLSLKPVKKQLQSILLETEEKISAGPPESEDTDNQQVTELPSAQDFTFESIGLPIFEITGGKIEWSEDLSVGDETLDSQHQEFISLLNRFLKISDESEKAEDLVDIIRDLADFTYEHFMSENEYLAVHEFPLWQQHQDEHMVFLKKLTSLVTAVEVNQEGIEEEIIDFMKEWISMHIAVSDQKYALWVRSRENM